MSQFMCNCKCRGEIEVGGHDRLRSPSNTHNSEDVATRIMDREDQVNLQTKLGLMFWTVIETKMCLLTQCLKQTC